MTWWLSTAALGCLLLAEQVTMSSKKDLTAKTEEICTSSSSSSMKLTCKTGEILHVISVQYQKMTPSCESPPGASCVFLQETQADSLYTDCNGVATCQMEVHKFWVDTVCGDTTTYQAVTSYECVSAESVNICNNVNVTDADATMFLVSPGYPRGLTSAANTCICDVTGSAINVTILEYYIYPVASMSLTGDNETWDSVTAGSLTYNTLVLENTERLRVVFHGNKAPGKARGVWMKVQGSTTLTLTCNGGPSPVLSSTRLTQDLPAATSATSRRPLQEVTECRDSERTLTFVSSVYGVAILFLLVVIAAIIVYFKAIKPSRNTAVVRDQTEGEPTYSQLGHVGQSGDHTESARPYSGLMDTTYSTVFSTEQSLVCSDHYTSIQDVHGYAKVYKHVAASLN